MFLLQYSVWGFWKLFQTLKEMCFIWLEKTYFNMWIIKLSCFRQCLSVPVLISHIRKLWPGEIILFMIIWNQRQGQLCLIQIEVSALKKIFKCVKICKSYFHITLKNQVVLQGPLPFVWIAAWVMNWVLQTFINSCLSNLDLIMNGLFTKQWPKLCLPTFLLGSLF